MQYRSRRTGAYTRPWLGLIACGLAAPALGQTHTDADADTPKAELAPIAVEGAMTVPTARDPVDGYVAERSETATKIDVPLIETPQSISVISREQIEDRGADDLTEAVTYSPGIYRQNSINSRVIDSFSLDIRGFSARDAIFRDGTRIFAGLPYDAPVETYGVERIEVLRGPASVLYGQGQPGGLINLVTKQPTAAPLREFGLEMGTYHHKQLTGDISDTLDDQGRWRYRLTGLWQQSETYVDYVNDDHLYLAPALSWEPSERTRLTLLAHYQDYDTRYPWTAFPRFATKQAGPYGKVDDSLYIGEPALDSYQSHEWAAGYLFEHDFGDRWRFRQNLRYRDITYDRRDTFRLYGSGFFGPGPNYIGGPDDRTIERAQRVDLSDAHTTTIDNQLQSEWQHGRFQHTLLAGVDYKTLSLDSRQSHSALTGSSTVPTFPAPGLDIYDPEYGRLDSLPPATDRHSTDADQVGLYIQDHIKFDDRWVVSIGGRQDWVSEKTDDADDNDQDEFSVRAGVVYLADNGLAPYASYSEAFVPQYGQNDFSGQKYEPITGRQYEFGLRYRPPGLNLSATAALFEITRENEIVQNPANPTNPQDQIQVGETRSRGGELGLVADLTNHLKAIASYTYQEVEVVDGGGTGATNGKQLIDKPKHLAKLWLDYSFTGGPLAGLGLGGGVRYNGSAYANADNSYEYPSVTLVDAAVRYDLTDTVRLQATAHNLLDKRSIYCSGRDPRDTCTFGTPREIIGSVTYRWD